MSCNEWESGTIKLPTAEFTKVRKAVEVAERAVLEAAFEKTQVFWKGLTAKQKRDNVAYDAAVYQFAESLRSRLPHGFSNPDHDSDPTGVAATTAALLFQWVPRGEVFTAKRVQRGSVKFPTNKTLTFQTATAGACIQFNRDTSEVTWRAEGNRAIDRAHQSPVGKTFWDAIDKVRWTRGTGGQGVGNNEYASEADYVGGGANYGTWAVGPIGEKADKHGFKAYTDSKGVRHAPPRSTVRAGGWW